MKVENGKKEAEVKGWPWKAEILEDTEERIWSLKEAVVSESFCGTGIVLFLYTKQ